MPNTSHFDALTLLCMVPGLAFLGMAVLITCQCLRLKPVDFGTHNSDNESDAALASGLRVDSHIAAQPSPVRVSSTVPDASRPDDESPDTSSGRMLFSFRDDAFGPGESL